MCQCRCRCRSPSQGSNPPQFYKSKKREVIPKYHFSFGALQGIQAASRLACSATVAKRQYPPHTSLLKTVRRTVFLTPLTLSGFESPQFYKNKKREAIPKYHFSFGALQGIRTPDLLVRSQTLYPAELAAHFSTLIYYITEFLKIKCFFEKR